MTYEDVYERKAPDVKITEPSDLFPLLRRYGTKKQEHFLVVTLNGAQQVIKVHLVSVGLANRTLIHPREVFIRAIKDNSVAVILAHNHPSDSLEPSREDREATTRLVQAGKLLGIEVLDHLILGRERYYSFRAENALLA